MDLFELSDLTRLIQSNHGPCVTIMMPTHLSGPDQEQDALRLCDPYGQVSATHFQIQSGDDDLLDTAAAQTILHGGKVYAMNKDAMPSNASIAAVLRF
jgi:hypothetical protein